MHNLDPNWRKQSAPLRRTVVTKPAKTRTKLSPIAVVGLGYVGLPLSLQFARSNVRVIGLDVDVAKVELLNAGKSYIKHIEATEVARAVREKRFQASSDFGFI